MGDQHFLRMYWKSSPTHADIHEAAVEGAVQRLRPKLMTVSAVLASLIPTLWASGIGGDVTKPIARSPGRRNDYPNHSRIDEGTGLAARYVATERTTLGHRVNLQIAIGGGMECPRLGIAWYACSMSELTIAREAMAHRGRRLEYFTIVWNTLEGLIAIAAGLVAGSISLIGFGIDSFIEVTSGTTLLWRMSVDADVEGRERNEKLSLGIVSVCFIALAVYITYEALSDLIAKAAPKHSLPGIILACMSLVVTPPLTGQTKSRPSDG